MQVVSGLFSITRVCQLCGLSKNTYYQHRHPDERFADRYEEIKTKVKKIIKNNGAYGVKRIKKALFDKYKIEIGRDALGRLLKLWALSLRRNPRTSKKSVIKEILEAMADRVNLLIRTKITAPFQAVTSDITEIVYNNGKSKAYLAVHKDVFGQIVYGWALGGTMETKLVIASLRMATQTIKKLAGKITDEILGHSDQGSQYTSYDYVNEALKYGWIMSYSTPGTPTENPGQESFFGRLKDECKTEWSEAKTLVELEKMIAKRMRYYNNERLHTGIGLKSPKKFTLDFIKTKNA